MFVSLQRKISKQNLKSFVGKTLNVYAEGFDDNSFTYYGRAYFNAPDIDGKVLFTSEMPIEYGKNYQVKVIDCTDYDVIASVIK